MHLVHTLYTYTLTLYAFTVYLITGEKIRAIVCAAGYVMKINRECFVGLLSQIFIE